MLDEVQVASCMSLECMHAHLRSMLQVAVLTGLGAAPWVIKPLYGFLSDTVPIFGYKRRSYLIICGILGEQGAGCLPFHSTTCRSCSSVGFIDLGGLCRDGLVGCHGHGGALALRCGGRSHPGVAQHCLQRCGS